MRGNFEFETVRSEDIGNTSHRVVRDPERDRYAYVYYDYAAGQYKAPNFRGAGEWFGSIDYVASWASRSTANRRFRAEVESHRDYAACQ